MKKVYIVNKSAHNFTAALKFGELIPLSEGTMKREAPNSMHRQFSEVMIDSEGSDFILISGLSIMNVVACVIFAVKHKKLNVLLYKNGEYIERNLVFE